MRWFSYWIIWLIIRPLLWLLYGFKVVGVEHVPRKGGFILAANHQSYVDPPLLASAIPRVLHFFAKKELFENRLFGAVIAWFNAIPVRRGVYDPEAISRALEALNRGRALMFFPEGTRGDGHNFLPPKPGIGMVAKRVRVPIVPAYGYGTNRLKKMFLSRNKLKVILGPPLLPEDIDRYEDNKSGYMALAEDVMARISALRRVVQGEQ